MNKVAKVVFWLLVLIGIVVLASCSQPGSPIRVEASIDPKPIVGQVVTLHIVVYEEMKGMEGNNLVIIELPEGIELVRGELEYEVVATEDQPAVVDVQIRVLEAGDWVLTAYASWPYPRNTGGWTGDVENLFITSDLNDATVLDDETFVPSPRPNIIQGEGTVILVTRTRTPIATASPTITIPPSLTSTPTKISSPTAPVALQTRSVQLIDSISAIWNYDETFIYEAILAGTNDYTLLAGFLRGSQMTSWKNLNYVQASISPDHRQMVSSKHVSSEPNIYQYRLFDCAANELNAVNVDADFGFFWGWVNNAVIEVSPRGDVPSRFEIVVDGISYTRLIDLATSTAYVKNFKQPVRFDSMELSIRPTGLLYSPTFEYLLAEFYPDTGNIGQIGLFDVSDGSQIVSMDSGELSRFNSPVWSQSGKWVIVTADPFQDIENLWIGGSDFYRLSVTGEIEQLTYFHAWEHTEGMAWGATDYKLSPDERYLAAIIGYTDQGILIIDLDTGDVTIYYIDNLIVPLFNTSIEWTPDQSGILISTEASGVYILDILTAEITRIEMENSEVNSIVGWLRCPPSDP